MKFQKTPPRIGFVALGIAVLFLSPFVVGRMHQPNQMYEELKNSTIVGGQESDPNEFPYFVSIGGVCGGSLIAPRVVLTAAHCSPKSYVGEEVTIGATKRDDVTSSKRRRVLKGWVHPFFGKNPEKPLSNDYGLLLLEEPYFIRSNIRLVINKRHKEPKADQMLKVIGMGTTKYGGPVAPTLRDVPVPFVKRRVCRESYGSRITKKMICAGEVDSGEDACQGDSGGPLVRRDRNNEHLLVGITSWGIDCGKYPGVYARVSKGMNWIQKKVCDDWKVGTPELCDVRVVAETKLKAVCRDDPSFEYQKNSGKNCSWVGQNPKGRCKWKQGNRRVRNYCKQTCNRCDQTPS